MDQVRTSADLRAALKALGLSQAEAARLVNEASGLSLTGSNISSMCSDAATGRQPSAAVRAVITMMLRQSRQPEHSAAAALIAAGWTPPGAD